MERVWLKHGDKDKFLRVGLTDEGKLNVGDIAKRWDLDRETFCIGYDAIRIDQLGLSVDSIDEIRGAAAQIDAGDGKSKNTAFIVEGNPKAPADVGASLGAGSVDPVKLLMEKYASRAKEARNVNLERNPRREGLIPMDEELWLVSPGDGTDPGRCFGIRGREGTLAQIVKGAGMAYMNYTRAISTDNLDDGIRRPYFNDESVEFWNSGSALDCLKDTLHGDRLIGFQEMVESSLGFSGFLYHNVHDYRSGELHPVERGLVLRKRFADILALRLLFACISTTQTGFSYEEMLLSISSFARDINLNDVLMFFRGAMDVEDGKPILLSLFIDEINCAEQVSGGTTWVQEVLSAYVHSLEETRVTKVLLVLSVSCSQHDAASLRRTASRLTMHVPIPVPSLDLGVAIEVVNEYFQRLSRTLGHNDGTEFQANDILLLCIELMGGMPRYLGFMLRGMVTAVLTDGISAPRLLKAAQRFDVELLLATLKNTVALCPWNPVDYKEGPGFTVIVSAMRCCLLGTHVYRHCSVVPVPASASYMYNPWAKFKYNSWGSLEQKGLLSLVPVNSDPVVDPGQWKCRVYFPPILALAMQDMRPDIYGTTFPGIMERGFRCRELSDLKFVAFMILLLKSATIEPPLNFSLDNIIPCFWYMHQATISMRFSYPKDGEFPQFSTRSRVTGSFLREMVDVLGPCFSLLSCGNFGLDSVHVLDGLLMVIQTRSSDDALNQPESNASRIFWSCFSDLTGVARLGTLTAEDLADFGPQPHDLRVEVAKLVEELPSTGGPQWGLQDVSPKNPPTFRRTTQKLKLCHPSFAGMDGEEDHVVEIAEAEGCYNLDNIVYIYSSDHHIEESEAQKIMRSSNPLCKRIIIRDNDSLGFLDVLASVRHLTHLRLVSNEDFN